MSSKDNELLDIESVVDKLIANNLDASIFAEIDESDVPRAPNVLDFCIGKEFLSLHLPPYPRQIQMMLELFQDYCPDCSDMQLIGDMHKQSLVEILDRTQLLNFGVCPKCKKNRLELFKDAYLYSPYELVACIGQRSGKSAVTAMCSNYLLHRFLTIPNPSQFFGVQPTTFIGTFTALDQTQAMDSLFTPFTEYLDNSQWYKNYHSLLDYYGKKLGKELYQVQTMSVWYSKGLIVHPKGPDKRRMRGRTRFLYSVDEIGWFTGDADAVKISADEVNHALERSMTTVRQGAAHRRIDLHEFDVPNAMAFNISSPSHANDPIMRLMRGGKKDPSKRVFHYATWEAHPNITRASLEPEFRRNPIAAERDYGAVPPIADCPFISNKEAVEKCFGAKPQTQLVSIYPHTGIDTNGNNYVYNELKVHVSDKNTPFVLALDAGYSNNAFAVSMSHWEDEEIHHDILIEISPTPDATVNFSKVAETVIAPLFNNFNIALVVCDRWQGLKMLSDLEEQYQCKTEQYSLKWDDFIKYRQLVLDNSVHCAKPESPIEDLFDTDEAYETLIHNKPVLTLALQMMTVREIGKMVHKPEGLDDDIWRTVVLASSFLLDDDYKFLRTKSKNGFLGKRVLGTYRTKSGSGSGGSGGAGRTNNKIGLVRGKTIR